MVAFFASRSLSLSALLVSVCLLCCPCWAQVPAVDSMGAHIERQNWRSALYWALKAGEDYPPEKYWRYLNAAEFASRIGDANLTFRYLTEVVHSDICTQAYFGNSAFDWLREDVRWKALMVQVEKANEQLRQQRLANSQGFRRLQHGLIANAEAEIHLLDRINSGTQLYAHLQKSRHLIVPGDSGRYRYGWRKLNDSTQAPYLIQLPPHFDYRKDYPLLVVLHGAVGQNLVFPPVPDSTQIDFFGWSLLEQASLKGMIVVAPYSTRQYNWMMPDDGFTMVPHIIQDIKRMYNIDDARVYMTGHSNGATGAFSYLMKQPDLFAAFSGLNNRPQVRTGGTFLKNALNRCFYNIATDYDYYYPLPAHQQLQSLADSLGICWMNRQVVGGYTHGYLITAQDSLTNSVYGELFDFMLSHRRDPFGGQRYWECDDVGHGRCDWLEITQLDTSATRRAWHDSINFVVKGWRPSNAPAQMLDSTSAAFRFPRRSGAVEASYQHNVFHLRTSCVGAVSIYVSPQMVNILRPIRVFINGKRVFSGKISLNKQVLMDNFNQQYDRQALWVNKINLVIPSEMKAKRNRSYPTKQSD